MTPASITPAEVAASDFEGLYVHIPFCFHKCHYCDFYSITRQSPERMHRFVDRILVEARMCADGRTTPIRPRTVFFGGGTPSLLPPDAMSRLIEGLNGVFDFAAVREFTVECNPETVDPGYLTMLRGRGVDRISLGAQSFKPGELKLLERHHDPASIPRVIGQARQAGFERLNIDLIFAIPGQTLGGWLESLDAGLQLGTGHLSAYALTYEPNTALTARKRLGLVTPAADDLELEMLHRTRQAARAAGLRPYEISNFAVAGQECGHNLNYWRGGNYLGLGPSAASHADGRRWKNRPHLSEWESGVDAGDVPAVEVERLTLPQRIGEMAMLMLRLDEGVDMDTITRRLGTDPRPTLAPTLARLSDMGLVRWDSKTATLTETGIPVADAIAAELLAPVDET